MKKTIPIAISIFAISLCISCAPKASDEQLNQMCSHLVELKQMFDLRSADERIAKIEEEYKFKAEHLKSQLDRDLKGWDDALKVQLEEAEKPVEEELEEGEKPKTEEEKQTEKAEKIKKVNESFQKNIDMSKGQYEKDIAKLGPRKESAIRAAKVKAEEAKTKAAEFMKKCVTKAKEKGISAELVACRLAAKDINDYRNNCK